MKITYRGVRNYLTRTMADSLAEGISVYDTPDWGSNPEAARYHVELMGAARALEALGTAGYDAADVATAAAQGDALDEQRAMDAKHAAIYRWIINHPAAANLVMSQWVEDEEAEADELHDALAARAQAKEGASND